jgi:V8-like Glu-specific endopeptidase
MRSIALFSVIFIFYAHVQASAEVIGNGTGFYIDKSTIVTCAHCVPEGTSIIVARSDSKLLAGRLIFVDRKLDIALLTTEEPNEFWLSLGNSDSLKLLDDLSVYGFPLAATLGTDLSASQGKLNSRRKIDENVWLQLDATMNPGNSGGPVVNKSGESVGIAVARLDQFKSLKETGALPERINFAIPSNVLASRLAKENLAFLTPNIRDEGFDPRDGPINSTVLLLISKNGTDGQVAKTTDKTSNPPPRILYPWKTHVVCSIFWIGEKPTERSSRPNSKSSWDQNWLRNYGGYDDPDPAVRIANHSTGEFRPKSFVPKLNPFYIALPYNDLSVGRHKAEAARVIPWFKRSNPEPGVTICKDRWLQIYNGARSCYGQWQDCGPGETDDWDYVFGQKAPKASENGFAGIAISPSIRDYLGLRSGQKVHWRFVEEEQVPSGPWKKYGPARAVASDPNLLAQQRYLEYLRRLRDEEFQKNAPVQNR